MKADTESSSSPSADKVWGGILAMLVHDLRTPLSSIVLNLELLEQGAAQLTPDQREDIAYALSSARALSEMISGMGDLAHLTIGAGRPEIAPIDLVAIAHEAASRSDVDRAERADIRVEAPSEPVSARGNADLMRRLVRELTAQALAVTPRGDAVIVRVRSTGEAARIEVVDRGASIAPEHGEMLFDLAGTLRLRDAHRGLSRGITPVVCRLAAEAQGGRAGLGERPPDSGDRGNTFFVELPSAP